MVSLPAPPPGLLAAVNRYLLLQYLVAGNMSQGGETGLNSAPLIRSYPGSWTWDTWVNKVVEETRRLGFSELKALSFRRYLSYQLASGREASYPSPGLKPTIQPNT